jgi:TP901 family phage tail tape measure protein
VAKILDAKAIISAEDKTGGVFASIAKKFMDLSRTIQKPIQAPQISAGHNRLIGQLKRQADQAAAYRRPSIGNMPMAGAGVMGAARSAASNLMPYAGAAGVAYGATSAVREYAELERVYTRLGLTAGASREEMVKVREEAQTLANKVAMPLDSVTKGYESLAAQGRKMKDIQAFMPSVAATAQASGAEVVDIANTAGAVGEAFKISGKEMQKAFDIMVKGGQEGKFELKNMAQYLPSLAPAGAAVGLKGQEGLSQMVATLQVIRNQTGGAQEAAASMSNIFQKMESEETANKFKKFGIDLRKEMESARKEGKNLLSFFVELSDKATKGDLSKIPQLFADSEFSRGMRALLSQKGEVEKLMALLKGAGGTVDNNLKRVLEDSKTGVDRLSGSWSKFKVQLGESASVPLVPVLEGLAHTLQKLSDDKTWSKIANHARNLVVYGQNSDMPAAQAFEEYNKNKDHQKIIDYYDGLKKQASIAKKEFDKAQARVGRLDENKYIKTSSHYKNIEAERDQKKQVFDQKVGAYNDAMGLRDSILAKEKQWGDVREKQQSTARLKMVQAEQQKENYKGRQIFGNFSSKPSMGVKTTGHNLVDGKLVEGKPYTSISYDGLDGGFKPSFSLPHPAPPQRPADLTPTLKSIEAIFSGGKIEATVKPDQVKASVTGEAILKNQHQIDVNVQFNTEMFNAAVRRIAKEETAKIPLSSQTSAGSTGKTMPEVGGQ